MMPNLRLESQRRIAVPEPTQPAEYERLGGSFTATECPELGADTAENISKG
jgi:hypothetical protein